LPKKASWKDGREIEKDLLFRGTAVVERWAFLLLNLAVSTNSICIMNRILELSSYA
jgi:hypothetical protein